MTRIHVPHLHRFIDPRALAAVKDLALLAKTVVDGFMYGGHPSRTTGSGLEFTQYRSYEPGDDLRRIDWKLYARSDRFYVREAEVETSVDVRIVLDGSASMLHEEDGLCKFDYARFLVAALAFLASRQGDGVGVYTLRQDHLHVVEPGRGPRHLHRVLHHLETLDPGSKWPDWEVVEHLFTVGAPRGLVVVVTDAHERDHEIRAVVKRLQALRHEVLLFHLLGRRELDLSYDGVHEFEDLETGRVVPADPSRIRAVYRERMRTHLEALRQELRDTGIVYTPIFLDEPLDGALRTFLTRRQRQ